MNDPLDGARRFLVKLADERSRSLAGSSLSAAGASVGLEPLFPASAGAGTGFGIAEANLARWYITKLPGDGRMGYASWKGLNPWDVAQQLAKQEGVLAVEPDLLQAGTQPDPGRIGLAVEDRCDPGTPLPSLPSGRFGWHLDDGFSQLRRARDGLGAAAAPVTIAHLDTGYDPRHAARPAHFDLDRQKNFFDDGRPDDASDTTDPQGLLKSLGHGTGTVGILAGQALKGGALPPEAAGAGPVGGAPDATVVPVRVADFVAQISTSSVARGLDYARRIGADVVSMSLGGWPSQAWADAVNAAYEAGVVLVCAAGNNYNGLPMRQIVWPARFRRAIAVCGVMADGRPYADLGFGVMEGCFGPPSKMGTAVAAYTPNIPWAILGCENVLRVNGAGTSSATPQVAAAAALWLQKHKPALEAQGIRGWARVEAVREALFGSADNAGAATPSKWFGRGILKANAMLAREPAAEGLVQTPRDKASFPFLDLLFGRALAPDPATASLALEATQVIAQSTEAAAELPDPETAEADAARRVAQILLDGEKLSAPLRAALEAATGARAGIPLPKPDKTGGPPAQAEDGRPAAPADPTVSLPQPPDVTVAPLAVVRAPPKARRLRIFATDPLAGNRLATRGVSEATVEIPWEPRSGDIRPGPIGEYVAVIDIDPASGLAYHPVSLNDRTLVAEAGLAPSVANPQFHQQMVYAVAMRAIDRFEQALGRVALWAPRPSYWEDKEEKDRPSAMPKRSRGWYERGFVRQLRIHPHALRQANAYYSPAKVALLFGYFPEARPTADGVKPGATVFTCLSHDIVAHETTHALLDGTHRRYQEATNPDVLAFHEAFADIVALFLRFSLPELLAHEIRLSRGDLSRSRLGELARQFGEARGHSAALRDALGSDPDEKNYETQTEAHDRGAVLVAAVFDAYVRILKTRTAGLMRLAGIGERGTRRDLHPDLVDRLAREAAKVAGHVLDICIRALDYCPPVDLYFPDYLRALITADSDLVPDDPYGYRVAFMESFQNRRIYPTGIRTVSTETLRWGRPASQPEGLAECLKSLPLRWGRSVERLDAYATAKEAAARLHDWMAEHLSDTAAAFLHLDRARDRDGKPPRFEVHSVRPARRVSPDGQVQRDIIVVITQKRTMRRDPQGPDDEGNRLAFRSGVTLVIDADAATDPIRYAIWKSPWSEKRLCATRDYLSGRGGEDGMRLYFGDEPGRENPEPFAMAHWGH